VAAEVLALVTEGVLVAAKTMIRTARSTDPDPSAYIRNQKLANNFQNLTARFCQLAGSPSWPVTRAQLTAADPREKRQ
jgi:hypothetical protein